MLIRKGNNRKGSLDVIKIYSIMNFILKYLSFICILSFSIFLCVNDKLVIAQYPRAILTNILFLSHILLLLHSPEGS